MCELGNWGEYGMRVYIVSCITYQCVNWEEYGMSVYIVSCVTYQCAIWQFRNWELGRAREYLLRVRLPELGRVPVYQLRVYCLSPALPINV